MLVLARKAQETIHIGEEISISIVSIRGRVVRVGIEAPSGVRVVRGELLTEKPVSDSDSSTVREADKNVAGGVAPSHAPETFKPPAKISTEFVNRALSLRRFVRPSVAQATAQALAASRSVLQMVDNGREV